MRTLNDAHILLVEDERSVARGLLYSLSANGYRVHWVTTGRAALDAVATDDVDLILLDIRLPDLSGFDVCRQLRTGGSRMPILMLTAQDEEMDQVLGLELGADDYVVKPYRTRELLSRIRAQLRRAYGELAQPAAPQKIRFGEFVFDPVEMILKRQETVVDLTPTERRLLRHLLLNPRHPLSREQLIEAVWGYESGIGSDRTVDVHVRHLREKIERDAAEPRYLVTVRGIGYKFMPE